MGWESSKKLSTRSKLLDGRERERTMKMGICQVPFADLAISNVADGSRHNIPPEQTRPTRPTRFPMVQWYGVESRSSPFTRRQLRGRRLLPCVGVESGCTCRWGPSQGKRCCSCKKEGARQRSKWVLLPAGVTRHTKTLFGASNKLDVDAFPAKTFDVDSGY